MPSHSIPVDKGQYDLLVTIAHEGCTVTVQENEGRDGSGATVSHQVYEFASETEAQRFYSAKVRTLDPSYAFPTSREAIPYWLPEDFRVYTNGGIVTNNAGGMQGFEGRILPTVNQYRGEDGGYVAFYSRDPTKAVYSVGGGIYVVGQIRLKGRYKGRIFHPEGYENQDISAAQEFKELCFKTFGVQGWAGGDTGGWFGR
ncbi:MULTISPECIES: hypothetical protein [Desertifilum]|uniref:hypothetical protein n=1 Tax=unclassified Desertifilum TaxID=2621682 RepID=UPI000AF66B67|nr:MULTISPECIES: hypothetical protein [Desertifilum]MDA0210555.1 hypothetical protein [Cyanobacteria bacterium FC1]